MPALPQHWSEPGSSRSRSAGMAREHGERGVVHPLGVLQVTGRVVGDLELERARPAAGPRSARSSHTSRTLAASASAAASVRGGGRTP